LTPPVPTFVYFDVKYRTLNQRRTSAGFPPSSTYQVFPIERESPYQVFRTEHKDSVGRKVSDSLIYSYPFQSFEQKLRDIKYRTHHPPDFCQQHAARSRLPRCWQHTTSATRKRQESKRKRNQPNDGTRSEGETNDKINDDEMRWPIQESAGESDLFLNDRNVRQRFTGSKKLRRRSMNSLLSERSDDTDVSCMSTEESSIPSLTQSTDSSRSQDSDPSTVQPFLREVHYSMTVHKCALNREILWFMFM
jgi:hypothetical protein